MVVLDIVMVGVFSGILHVASNFLKFRLGLNLFMLFILRALNYRKSNCLVIISPNIHNYGIFAVKIFCIKLYL